MKAYLEVETDLRTLHVVIDASDVAAINKDLLLKFFKAQGNEFVLMITIEKVTDKNFKSTKNSINLLFDADFHCRTKFNAFTKFVLVRTSYANECKQNFECYYVPRENDWKETSRAETPTIPSEFFNSMANLAL
uniref:Uncharacterized protein n=1 Tax=Panagrellus redivivus TaxID=6233 RepID=A0A7E4WDX0_PANRE